VKNKIAFFRERKGLTQEKLSKMAGISRPYLSDLENCKCEPGGLVILKISNSLDEPVEKIFFADNVNHVEQNGPQIEDSPAPTSRTGTE
jgi:transcriptional regulator with XRE-family HTH domain